MFSRLVRYRTQQAEPAVVGASLRNWASPHLLSLLVALAETHGNKKALPSATA